MAEPIRDLQDDTPPSADFVRGGARLHRTVGSLPLQQIQHPSQLAGYPDLSPAGQQIIAEVNSAGDPVEVLITLQQMTAAEQ